MVGDQMIITDRSASITGTGISRIGTLTYMRLACLRVSCGSPCIEVNHGEFLLSNPEHYSTHVIITDPACIWSNQSRIISKRMSGV